MFFSKPRRRHRREANTTTACPSTNSTLGPFAGPAGTGDTTCSAEASSNNDTSLPSRSASNSGVSTGNEDAGGENRSRPRLGAGDEPNHSARLTRSASVSAGSDAATATSLMSDPFGRRSWNTSTPSARNRSANITTPALPSASLSNANKTRPTPCRSRASEWWSPHPSGPANAVTFRSPAHQTVSASTRPSHTINSSVAPNAAR